MECKRKGRILNREGFFSDESSMYRIPVEPKAYERVQIRFRAPKNQIDQVSLVCGTQEITMEKEYENGRFIYYTTFLFVEEEMVTYYFRILCEDRYYYYTRIGLNNNLDRYHMFSIKPDFKTPHWAKGAVMYQIFVDRFANGERENDVRDQEYYYLGEYVKQVKDWDTLPELMDVRRFYGGDLQGVWEKLDYLQELGVEVLYLNPIFVSPSNHKYDIQDYNYVDPHFTVSPWETGGLLETGEVENSKASFYQSRVANKKNLEASNQFFIKFIEEVHRRGMKVILDGVFNHSGSFHYWLDREGIYKGREGFLSGAYQDKNSPYHDYYSFQEEGGWPNNESYDKWWGNETLPKLNYEGSSKLYEEIMTIAKKWVSPPYHADGWRLDVAADLGHSEEFNHQFWKDFRKSVKEGNEQAVILAEHYGNPLPWLQGEEWDSIMNYDGFMDPISWFLTGMEKHSDRFREDLLGNSEAFWKEMIRPFGDRFLSSVYVSMNQLSNHDHSRFLTRTNQKVGRAETLGSQAASQGIRKEIYREAVVLQMTWPGSPTIYYGEEVGLCGFTDPDSRRTFPWGREDQELLKFYKDVIKIHKEHEVLLSGSLSILHGGKHVISYGRFQEESQIVVVINNQESEAILRIPVWLTGVLDESFMIRLLSSDKNGYTCDEKIYEVVEGYLSLKMGSYEAIILKAK